MLVWLFVTFVSTGRCHKQKPENNLTVLRLCEEVVMKMCAKGIENALIFRLSVQ